MIEEKFKIVMPLITHIAKTNNKVAPNKFLKINNQAIYNGALNRFGRAIAVENMHTYFSWHIPKELKGMLITQNIGIEYIFHTVINHGSISLRKGKLIWKIPKDDYVPNWDLNNLSDIWIKTGNDSLSISKVITDDNIGIIKKTSYEFVQVEHIKDMKLEVIINILK